MQIIETIIGFSRKIMTTIQWKATKQAALLFTILSPETGWGMMHFLLLTGKKK